MSNDPLLGKKILIVDDYEINQELFKIFVSETGAFPITASNGKQCLQIVQNKKIDMILMDLNMPEMNGLEATSALRENPACKNIVIIGVIGYEDSDQIDICIKAGMNDAIPKLSFNPEKLIELGNKFFSEMADINKTDNITVTEEQNITSTMPKDTVLDFNRALKEFENDKDLLLRLLDEFKSILANQIIHITQLLISEDYQKIEFEAHSIKGGAMNICAYKLADAAKNLEKCCRKNGHKSEMQDNVDILQKQIELFIRFVEQLSH